MKRLLKKVIGHYQWVTAFALAFLIFWASPFVLQFFDSEAGFNAYDMGYVQKPIIAFVWAVVAIGAMWVFVQLVLPTVDDWLDVGGFKKMWATLVSLTNHQDNQWLSLAAITVLLFFLLGCLTLFVLTYLLCLRQVPI
jgi:hypothetical protein